MKPAFHWLKSSPYHPILFGIFPVLALYANNAGEVGPDVLPRPLLVSLGLAAATLLAVRLLVRGWQRAALLASLLLVLFFSYGQVYDLKRTILPLADLMRHRFLAPFFLMVLIVGVVLILRMRETIHLTAVFNLVGAALLIMSLGQLGLQALTSSRENRQASEVRLPVRPLNASPGQPLPSVYFILLDGYMRSDALLRDMQYDNSKFVQELENLGFYVPSCSRANYFYTQGTMTTALNMDDLGVLQAEIEQSGLQMDIFALIKHSKVRQQLEALGYKTVAFDSGYEWSRIRDADIYLGLNRDTYAMQSLNPFEAMLLKSTLLRIYTDETIKRSQAGLSQVNSPFNEHIELERFILARLPDLAKDPAPKFVFAHILIPHWPYIFLPDGSVRDDPNFDQYNPTDEQIRQGYVDSVAFVSSRITTVVKQILADSETPPIIVIFGDHGLEKENRLQNFTAIYLTGSNGDLYDTITPVNFFRVIFNRVFNAGYEILPDFSYLDIDPGEGVNIQPVTETAPECLDGR